MSNSDLYARVRARLGPFLLGARCNVRVSAYGTPACDVKWVRVFADGGRSDERRADGATVEECLLKVLDHESAFDRRNPELAGPPPKSHHHYETREVLAGAYQGRRQNLKAMLTHAVELDEAGRQVRVLCERVQLDSICDGGGVGPDELAAEPTCKVCKARLKRAKFQAMAAAAGPLPTSALALASAEAIGDPQPLQRHHGDGYVCSPLDPEACPACVAARTSASTDVSQCCMACEAEVGGGRNVAGLGHSCGQHRRPTLLERGRAVGDPPMSMLAATELPAPLPPPSDTPASVEEHREAIVAVVKQAGAWPKPIMLRAVVLSRVGERFDDVAYQRALASLKLTDGQWWAIEEAAKRGGPAYARERGEARKFRSAAAARMGSFSELTGRFQINDAGRARLALWRGPR